MGIFELHSGSSILGDNPLLRRNDLIDLFRTNTIRVSQKYGNDSTARIDSQDYPCKTLERAYQLINSSSVGNYVINVEIGTYNLTTSLKHKNGYVYNIIGASRSGVKIISSSTDHLIDRWAGHTNFGFSTIKDISLELNAVSKQMFKYNMRFAEIRNVDITLTNGTLIGIAGVKKFINCDINCIVGNLGPFYSNRPPILIQDSKVKVLSSSAMFLANSSGDIHVDNSILTCNIGSIYVAGSNSSSVKMLFKNSLITSFKESIYLHHSSSVLDGGYLKYIGYNFLEITGDFNGLNLGFRKSDKKFNYVFDTLVIYHSLATVRKSIIRTGRHNNQDIIIQNKIYSNLSVDSYQPSIMGADFTNTTTVGDIISVNFLAPYDLQNISYTIPPSATSVTIANGIKALIDVQVVIPGTSWNEFTGGNLTNVTVDGLGKIFITQDVSSNELIQFKGLTDYFKLNGSPTPLFQESVNHQYGAGFINQSGGDTVDTMPKYQVDKMRLKINI